MADQESGPDIDQESDLASQSATTRSMLVSIVVVAAVVALLLYSSWRNRTWDEKFVGHGFRVTVEGINSRYNPIVNMVSPSGRIYDGEATNDRTDVYSGTFEDSDFRFLRDDEGMKIWKGEILKAVVPLVDE